MRLLILGNKMPFPPIDGGAFATLNLAKGLSNFISDIDLLVFNTKKHFFDISNIPIDLKNKLNFHDVKVDTSINILNLLNNLFFSKLPYNAQRFVNKDFEEKLRDLLKFRKYDIVQIEGLYMLYYIPIIREYSSALISYRAHNIESVIWQRRLKNSKFSFKNIYLSILTKRLEKFEKSFINKYDLLIPITDKDSEFFERSGNIKSKITIPTGINKDDYQNIVQELEFPSFFYIGALDWSPNQEGLVWFLKEVWPKVIEKSPDLKFYIAGRNAPKWIENLFDNTNIVYLGEIEDAKQYISSKSVMIVPLFSGSGMRIKIIEAMALSKAIISTSIGTEGINSSNEENILITNSVSEMVEVIIDLSLNFEKVKNLGSAAKIFVSKYFDNFVLAKQLFCFYENSLNIRSL